MNGVMPIHKKKCTNQKNDDDMTRNQNEKKATAAITAHTHTVLNKAKNEPCNNLSTRKVLGFLMNVYKNFEQISHEYHRIFFVHPFRSSFATMSLFE